MPIFAVENKLKDNKESKSNIRVRIKSLANLWFKNALKYILP